MITGRILPSGAPTVPVEFAGVTFDAVLDTGFEGQFELPVALAPILNPIPKGTIRYGLGTGGESEVDVYWVAVTFDDTEQMVVVHFVPGDEIILGLEMLAAYRVTLDFPAGTVTLDKP